MAPTRPEAGSPTERGLLQAILDDADDDGLRLIYADWLDEQGEADRAEFIRVQCAIARLEEEDPELLPLQRREWELLQKNREKWTPAFSRAISGRATASPFTFRRGLLSHVTLSAAKFAAHGRAMLRKAPTLHQLTLENLSEQGDRLRGCEHLARITDLELPRGGPLDWIDAVLDCSHLTRLAHLTLPLLPTSTFANPARARRLCNWAPLGRLRSLNLLGEPLDSEALQPLARSPLLANLHMLQLGYPSGVIGPGRVEDHGIQALMGSPHLSQLHELHLRAVSLGEEGIRALAGSRHTPRLSKLALVHIGLRPPLATPLFQSGAFQGLRSLSLRGNSLGDEGVKRLAGCRALANLRFLDLWYNNIGPEGIRALARSRYLEHLTGLDLSWNMGIGSEGVKELLSASFLPNLRYLNLSAVNLRASDLKALAACQSLSRLRQLSLSFNGELGDEGVKALARSPYLGNLLYLNLIGAAPGPEGRDALFQSPIVKDLLVLAIEGRWITGPDTDSFFNSPLPAQLLRLHLFPDGHDIPTRYQEELGDRLVVSIEHG